MHYPSDIAVPIPESRTVAPPAALASPAPPPARQVINLTVIVPAYNEAASLEATLHSLLNQTVPVDEIIVVDDCSTDDTAAIARAAGVTVIQPPQNTGSKAGAQNFALGRVQTEFTMAIDADTTLASDAIETLMTALDDSTVVAACGFVVPRHVRSVWERGRYIEYLAAFTFHKPIQDYYEKPLIASGCFSVFRTAVLLENGGWPTRTLAEDMDLTWTFYAAGHRVRFVPEAVCYPIEPHNFHFMSKQLRRWSHGFIQNVAIHRRSLLDISYLRSAVAVALWDATIASVLYLGLLPLLVLILGQPIFLIGYVIDAPVLLVPVLYAGIKRGETWQALSSLPAFFVLRMLNSYFFLEALIKEVLLRRPLRVYEKGH